MKYFMILQFLKWKSYIYIGSHQAIIVEHQFSFIFLMLQFPSQDFEMWGNQTSYQ